MDCLTCHSSTLQESQVLESGKYPVYGASGTCGYTDTPDYDGDAILIIKDGSGVGSTSFVTGKYSVIGTLNVLKPKKDVSTHYLYYSLKSFNFSPYRIGLAIPHIYFKDYGKATIWLPSNEEQRRRARLLSLIDTKISAERNILDMLAKQKAYLLSAMFI